MTINKFPFAIAGTALAVSALLSACGGGGDATAPGGTVTPTSGQTGTCTAAPCINFAEANVGLFEFGGLAKEILADPADATNQVSKLTKTTSSETWAGATVHLGSSDYTVTRIDPAQGITLRVYSPAVGKTIMVKLEGTGTAIEAQATSTKAGQWETLSFSYPTADANTTYNKVSVFPGFGTQLNEVYYIDELKYTAKSSGGSQTPVSGKTGTCTAAPCINFAEANIAFTPFEGLGSAVAVADPVDPSNQVGKLTKVSSGQPWAGATVDLGSSDHTVTNIDPAQGISLRVYSPAVGEKIMVKIEGTGAAQEAQATSTKANEWETLSFSYPNAEVAATYNKVSIFPGFMTQVNKDYYVDELKYTAKSSGSGGQNVTALTFSSGFASKVLTSNGGLVATAGGSNQDNFNCSGDPGWCGSFAGGSGADSFAGFYYQTSTPASALYSQIEVFGPNNSTGFSSNGDTSGVTISNQTKLNFKFNSNPEWFNSSSNKFGVVITLGKRYSIDGGCRIQLHGVKTPTSAEATAYSMSLANDFRVAADCGTGINSPTAALAASPVISSVKFIGAAGGSAIIGVNNVSSGANLSTVSGGVYPTTVVLKGPITFD